MSYINREEAIRLIDEYQGGAMDKPTAKKVLENMDGVEICEDTINRQAAIDALADYIHNVDRVYSTGNLSADDCRDAAHSVLDELPSAQPEIIRRPVKGYEGYYEVDNCGRVYALDRVIHVEDHGRSYDKPLSGGIIKQHMHSKGYKIVPLTRDGKTKNVFVHRIVATAFLPNPDNLPCINHKDEDKTNNFAENLEWCTYQYNNAYGSKPKKHSKWMRGRKLSDEHKQHISEGHKRYWDRIRAGRRTDGVDR